MLGARQSSPGPRLVLLFATEAHALVAIRGQVGSSLTHARVRRAVHLHVGLGDTSPASRPRNPAALYPYGHYAAPCTCKHPT